MDAMEQINQAVLLAMSENKHVLIQVGGNWCPWCIKIQQFMDQHSRIDSIIRSDYVLIHVNYSKENKNPEAMARLQYPQRFGFPVFVILDTEGNRIHTQNTLYLEEEESYNEKRLFDFLHNWNRAAVDPENY
jgi:thioredoxin-related protein